LSNPPFTLRPYEPTDETAAIDLWQRTWQQAYPVIDFAARREWWQQRWREEIIPAATILVAEADDAMIGFVTVIPGERYLDQIVVAPESWSTGLAEALLEEARRLSPEGLTLHVNKDNTRALRFYEKHGFVIQGGDVNPNSGRPVYKMSWRP
jgi:putative acetyltransferase